MPQHVDASAPVPLAAMPVAPPQAAPSPIRTVTLRLDGMIDRDVIGIDGGDIGHVIDVLVDRDGTPQAVLVETNGFLGVGDRKIAVAWPALSFGVRSGARPVVADMTVDQVRAAPAYVGGGAAEVAAGPLEAAPASEPPPVAASPAAVDDSAAGGEIAPYPAPLASLRAATRR